MPDRVVSYVDKMLHDKDITVWEDISFSKYFYEKFYWDVILYKYSDIVSMLKLKLKSHVNVETWDTMEDAQRFMYIDKTFKNLFVDIIRKVSHEIFIDMDRYFAEEEDDWGIYDTQRDLAAKAFVKEMNNLVKKLPSIDIDIYKYCLVDWLTYKEAWKILGISWERVRQYKCRLIKKLTSALSDLYLKYKEWFE